MADSSASGLPNAIYTTSIYRFMQNTPGLKLDTFIDADDLGWCRNVTGESSIELSSDFSHYLAAFLSSTFAANETSPHLQKSGVINFCAFRPTMPPIVIQTNEHSIHQQ